ncbi:hypothetical protein TYRP_019777 [Tyrophagus putrescentiae]|nr:hypothetical protein TYRP_019777 [Tyrophagus putrescentiae]
MFESSSLRFHFVFHSSSSSFLFLPVVCVFNRSNLGFSFLKMEVLRKLNQNILRPCDDLVVNPEEVIIRKRGRRASTSITPVQAQAELAALLVLETGSPGPRQRSSSDEEEEEDHHQSGGKRSRGGEGESDSGAATIAHFSKRTASSSSSSSYHASMSATKRKPSPLITSNNKVLKFKSSAALSMSKSFSASFSSPSSSSLNSSLLSSNSKSNSKSTKKITTTTMMSLRSSSSSNRCLSPVTRSPTTTSPLNPRRRLCF